MRLHRAFVLGAAAPIRRALSVVVDHLRGRRIRADDEQFLMAWQTFFMVVPVVSTTFASLPTLFRGLGAEALGWVLVDEAGQAQPQALAGAMWRAQRAVVVGDPLQLEPVLPVPRTVMRALGNCAGVKAGWTAITSAQEVADRVTPVGTYLPTSTDGEGHWVGTPLRVHRRCDRPIFDIFSEMAYGPGLLVFGTPSRAAAPGRNTWFHVPALHDSGKWSKELGCGLLKVLRKLWDPQRKLAGLGVLTPFREIAEQIGRLDAATYIDPIGTVHTAQGGEMDTVVLVLGTGSTDDRARVWLASSPNLLNVAVSRARRRLYVVGDHALWSHYPYVKELARLLPVELVDLE